MTEQRERLPAINVNLRPGEDTPGATTALMILPHGLSKIGGSPAAPGTRADACGAMHRANGGQSCRNYKVFGLMFGFMSTLSNKEGMQCNAECCEKTDDRNALAALL